MQYRFYTADVFTPPPHFESQPKLLFGGNQLAVFPQAQGLEPQVMQQIAQEFNLSETVFVFPPETAQGTRRLRIFTPGTELPFAGHPTVGTAYVLAAIGELPLTGLETQIVFEEGVGLVPVMIRAVEGKPIFSQLSAAKMPEFGPEPPAIADLALMLSLQPDDFLDGDLAPQAVSCGVPFLFIPLRDRAALQKAQLDLNCWKTTLASHWANQVYLFTRDPGSEMADLRARMFAPAMGIMEDPATGAAATALAGYLGSRSALQNGTLRWVVEQGFEMGRPSILEVEADKNQGHIVGIRVGGASVLVSEGKMEIPL
jgi:trans-2,3-dihydro-3-hydroxyanthranilate isomerase